jgi:hypothetical protein
VPAEVHAPFTVERGQAILARANRVHQFLLAGMDEEPPVLIVQRTPRKAAMDVRGVEAERDRGWRMKDISRWRCAG